MVCQTKRSWDQLQLPATTILWDFFFPVLNAVIEMTELAAFCDVVHLS